MANNTDFNFSEGLATCSPKQHEIAGMVCLGMSGREIAGQLGISPRTVDVHRTQLFKRTRCKNIAEFAYMMGRLDQRETGENAPA